MIVREGGKYVVKAKDGSRVLGKHHSKRQAIKQLQAIEISKKRRGK
jgi:hypothetical protein